MVFLRPLQKNLNEKMVHLRDQIIAQGEKALGRRIRYDSMGPSLFSTIDIRGIRIYSDEGDPFFRLKRLRIVYSPLLLLSGGEFKAVRSIVLDTPEVSFVASRDDDLMQKLFPPASSADHPSTSVAIPRDQINADLQIRVYGGNLRWASGNDWVRMTKLTIQGRYENDSLRFSGSLGLALSLGALPSALGPLHLDAKFSGSLSTDLKTGSVTLALPRLEGDSFSLKPLTVNVALQNGELEMRKIKDRLPFDLTLRYTFASEILKAELMMDHFSPLSFLTPRFSWAPLGPWLGGSFSGNLSTSLSLRGNVTYQGNLQVFYANIPPIGKAQVNLQARGTARAIHFDSLTVVPSQGNLEFQGDLDFTTWAPTGRLRISGFKTRSGDPLDADARISMEGRDLVLFADQVSLGTVTLSAVDVRVIREAQSLSFQISALRFSNVESYENVKITRISSVGSFTWKTNLLQASVSADSFAAADLMALLRSFSDVPPLPDPLPSLVDHLSMTTELFFSTDFHHFSFNIPRFVTAYQGNGDFFAVASISGTDTHFSITDGRLVWTGGSLNFSSSADFSDPTDINFKIDSVFKDLTYHVDGTLLDQRSLSLQGSYGFSSHLSIAEGGEISGILQVQALPIPWGEQRPKLSFAGSFRWATPAEWSITVDTLGISEVSLWNSKAITAELGGTVNQGGANFTHLSYDDGRGPLSGKAAGTWNPGFTSVSANLQLNDTSGNERYEWNSAYQGGSFNLRLYLVRAQIARLFPDAQAARVTGEVRLIWKDWSSYSVDCKLASLQTKMGDQDVALGASFSLTPQSLDVEDLALAYGSLNVQVPQFKIDRLAQRASGAFRLKGTAFGRDMDINGSGELAFSPFDTWDKAMDGLTTLRSSIQIQSARLDAWQSSEAFQINLEKQKDTITLNGGPKNSIRLQIGQGGAFYAAFSNPLPLRGSITGTLLNGIIDASTRDLYVDFPVFWALFNLQSMVDFTGGFLNATIRITGPLSDPEFSGRAEGKSVRLRVPDWVVGELGPASVDLVFNGNEMSFGPLILPAEKGYGTIQAKFYFDRWIPTTFTMGVSVPPTNAIPFKNSLFGVHALGLASGNLNLTLDEAGFKIGGVLTAQNTQVTLDTRAMTEAQGTSGGEVFPVFVDLLIKTDRKVEFLWPSEELPVVRGYADIGSNLHILSNSVAGRYSLTGKVQFRGGEVFYFQRSFYITEGILTFNENEIHFDPRLILRAEIRDRTDEGPVTIALVVNDAPLSTFTPRLESDPPLSQFDILSILGQNLTLSSQNNPNQIQNALIAASSDVFAQFNVIRVFEKNIRDTLNLDMFSVRTQVLQNAVLKATGLRSEAVDRMNGLGNYFDNTTVFMGKYFGPNLFVQSMLSLRYDPTKAYDLFGGMTLEPDIGMELRTPLFNLRWDFVPTHPEHLFIDDQSFTLSWKWSLK